ncbi:hypothetical protein TPHA_0N01590 [Tetrapisispora phaffii CBS 4417]|uniref:Uncharacterized protein n=1 Tax=Tetrapisispora phaffii (strain ATCC 24235 / CBS 4417 / NBRC 1672 / NRRL Y-8282 / UCD 70-5) TaxID=1071381 RepID=G8C1B2_TETPH|nr:hypothetical protein TPHA_0N01590 [Tetrapisispora phaffii CBS 4417]CCE65940.1 hypothetical protein TPHA_0N01590 [Tetrapisispora phaffii CBS 4417]
MSVEGPAAPDRATCKCKCCVNNLRKHRREQAQSRLKHVRGRFLKRLDTKDTSYKMITSIEYLNNKYGLKKTYYIEKFIKCIHKKIDTDVNKISDNYVDSLTPWVKVKLFFLLIALSQRGGPEYWLEKSDGHAYEPESDMVEVNDADGKESSDEPVEQSLRQDNEESGKSVESNATETKQTKNNKDENASSKKDSKICYTLAEQVMRQNIKQDFTEEAYTENYVFSSIWANFMEGLINHYLEKVIIPHSEMKVCQQLYKPMMKIISLYNEYNELIEKSERNGFLPLALNANNTGDNEEAETNVTLEEDLDRSLAKDGVLSESQCGGQLLNVENEDMVTKERLHKAQKLLWQARQDIPKTISKELTLLSEMYSTLSADEQDYKLDEFVGCAEEYIELEYLPSLIDLLFKNSGTHQFWKIMIVLEPYFYYIEDINDEEEGSDMYYDNDKLSDDVIYDDDDPSRTFKPDPRVITLEKICEVAAKQKWI